jgi:putative endonuclease
MQPTTNAIGDSGEETAVQYLKHKGFEILARNYRYKNGEIDIIAKQQNLLVFVEVKVRNNASYGPPETFVSRDQEIRIMDAAIHFMEKYPDFKIVRYDILALTQSGNGYRVHHVADAFY